MKNSLINLLIAFILGALSVLFIPVPEWSPWKLKDPTGAQPTSISHSFAYISDVYNSRDLVLGKLNEKLSGIDLDFQDEDAMKAALTNVIVTLKGLQADCADRQ